MKITVMTTDEQIVTLDVDRDESVIHSLFSYFFLIRFNYLFMEDMISFIYLLMILLDLKFCFAEDVYHNVHDR